MARRRKHFAHRGQTTFGLNVTSMTDMFTILLVFLLQSYASDDGLITPEEGLKMPVSNSEVNPIKALQLSVSDKELKLDKKPLLTLTEGRFPSSEVDPNDKQFLPPLFNELKQIEKKGPLVIMADEALSYETLRQVMYTASMAGFVQVKLATVAGQ